MQVERAATRRPKRPRTSHCPRERTECTPRPRRALHRSKELSYAHPAVSPPGSACRRPDRRGPPDTRRRHLAGSVGGFRGVIAVRVATVAVSVQDGRGHPITGLGPEDFRVLVDGQTVELTNFQAIVNGRPVVETRPRRGRPCPRPTRPRGAGDEPQPRRLPRPHLHPHREPPPRDARAAALRRQGLHPGDRVMVVAFTGQVRVCSPHRRPRPVAALSTACRSAWRWARSRRPTPSSSIRRWPATPTAA